MNDDVHWQVCVSKALLQSHCRRGQVLRNATINRASTNAQGAAEQPAGLASQTLP
jgi:hypothetical protein